jgi:hypothetical protein
MRTWDALGGVGSWLALTLLLAVLAGAVLPGGIVWGAVALGLPALGVGAWQVGREGVPPGSRLAAVGAPLDRAAVGHGVGGLALGIGVAAAITLGIAAAGGLRWSVGGAGVGPWLVEGVRSLGWLALPATAEEVLVRGYPLRAAAAVAGPAGGVWITACGFALLHLGNPGLGPWGLASLVAAGLFLGALVVRTGTLWWAIGAHLGWNWALAFLADVPVSGLDVADAPGLEAVSRGPTWLSGGAFGVEGSALAAAGLAAAAGAVFTLDRVRRTNRIGPGHAGIPTTKLTETDR